MRRYVIVVLCCLAIHPVSLAQVPDLKSEAKKPTFYPFALNTPIVVHERAVPEDFGGVAFSPLEAREIIFSFDEKDNHLTAKLTCTAVRVLDCVRTAHVALYDQYHRLLGTASASATIKRFIVNNVPTSEPVELTLDFGESITYKACKYFQLSVSGRGKSSAKFGMKDVDELFIRLTNARSPEGQRDAANALAALGEPVLPRLKTLAIKENRIGSLALEAIAKIGTQQAVKILDEQLRSPDISHARRIELYELLSYMPPPAFDVLAEELERNPEEDLQVAVVRVLAVMPDPRIGPFLLKCFQDETRYYGRVRPELAVALMKRKEKSAIPALIAALRDRSGAVRMAAAYALAEITNTDMPIEWNGTALDAWMNAPAENREVAVKRWEEWWKQNSAKFGFK